MSILLPIQSRAARGLLNWTINDLSSISNVSVSTIKRFEQGESINLNNLKLIHGAFTQHKIQFIMPTTSKEPVGVQITH